MQSGQNPVVSTNPDNLPGSSASPNDQNSRIIPYVNTSLHEKFRQKKDEDYLKQNAQFVDPLRAALRTNWAIQFNAAAYQSYCWVEREERLLTHLRSLRSTRVFSSATLQGCEDGWIQPLMTFNLSHGSCFTWDRKQSKWYTIVVDLQLNSNSFIPLSNDDWCALSKKF